MPRHYLPMQRYAYIREMASTRSILSIGLACFKPCKAKRKDRPGGHPGGAAAVQQLSAQVFNISVLSTCSYVVEPSALKFLHGHFEFPYDACRTALPFVG